MDRVLKFYLRTRRLKDSLFDKIAKARRLLLNKPNMTSSKNLCLYTARDPLCYLFLYKDIEMTGLIVKLLFTNYM